MAKRQSKRLGKQTLKMQNPPAILSHASVVGTKEAQGPLKDWFDVTLSDDMCGKSTFEQAENEILLTATRMAVKRAGLAQEDVHFFLAGDLLNQIVSASFAARELTMPFFGLYGACSTMCESLSLGSILIDGGFADTVLCASCSHFATAERQYRNPLELGSQRPPAAQWTVTGAGSTLLGAEGKGPFVEMVTVGKVNDWGISDANNMGAAMAPAAVDTLFTHFEDTGRRPEDYDLIATGDLGAIGSEILREMMGQHGIDMGPNYTDCGLEIFDREAQDVHAGGSGCGCVASVLNSYLLKRLEQGDFNRILVCATGALHSPTTSLQGETIPGIAHAVSIVRERGN